MNARQIAEANALLGAADYLETLVPQFTHVPPTPVDLKFATGRTRITQAIADLGGKQAIQSGGGYRADSARQGELREELEDHLGDVRTTAAAIAAETADPALMARFRMPDGRGDTELAATGLGMATAIRELSLDDEFEAHGYPAATATWLEGLVDGFKASEGDQGGSLGEQAGATAAIPGILRSGKTGIKILDSIFRRVFKGNAEVLAAWDTASHVERAPKPAAPAPPVPPLPVA